MQQLLQNIYSKLKHEGVRIFSGLTVRYRDDTSSNIFLWRARGAFEANTNKLHRSFRIKIGITFIFKYHHRPIQIVMFFPVGLSLLSRHF